MKAGYQLKRVGGPFIIIKGERSKLNSSKSDKKWQLLRDQFF
jgi:hypothetical protein